MSESNRVRTITNKSSIIFQQNRCIGYVSNHIPAVIRYILRRKDNLITTCIGRSFQVYTASHFRLIHVSPLHDDNITALATDRFYIYTASNKNIYVWRAGKHMVHEFKNGSHVKILLPFGKNNLVSVDDNNTLKVWDISEKEVYLEINFNNKEFIISALAHPPTYLNKVVIGSQQGSLKIWNIKNNSLIYTFHGKESSAITCIEPSPALDIVAVGYKSGTIALLNLKFDEIVMKFQQDWGSVTHISFRDDAPIMATSSSNGNIAFWNLEEKKISSHIQAHEDTVTTMIFLPQEPLLLTTSPDNSMKLWVFDLPNGGARMLRIREGHTGPPLCIRYHGLNGNSILSSGEDSSLRIFSTISESLHRSLGKASYNRKVSKKKNRFQEDNLRMSPIIEFTSETTREKEWDNIAAIHAATIQTTTWSFDKCRMGEHRLVPEKFQNKNRTDFISETTCIKLTHCGNFVIIGYSSGDVERFNIQSGLHRASYGAPAHKNAVRGVTSDNLNNFVVSGCSEGFVKYWLFKEKYDKPNSTLKFDDGIALIRSHFESSLIAIALNNFVIYVIDSDTKSIARKFEGHSAKINDMTFSPDSKWLITSSMDSIIKVWDIPSSYMIDHFKVERPCVSLTMSPTGDFLATAHVNMLGIYLWANKHLFNPLSLRSINPFDEAPTVGLPTSASDEISVEEQIDEISMNIDEISIEEGEEIDSQYVSPEQLSTDLITLSGLPSSRWQNLFDLELIKKRNKPKAPPKVPKQAPFFLPTTGGLNLKFDVPITNSENTSKVIRKRNLNNLTIFGNLLNECKSNDDYHKCFDHLKQFGPSMIDFEIKSLHPIGGGSYEVMTHFLNMIGYILKTNKNFELSQSYLSRFLKSHGLNLLESDDVMNALQNISEIQKRSWEQIEDQMKSNIGVIASLRNFAH